MSQNLMTSQQQYHQQMASQQQWAGASQSQQQLSHQAQPLSKGNKKLCIINSDTGEKCVIQGLKSGN